jgi:hypothetical protein
LGKLKESSLLLLGKFETPQNKTRLFGPQSSYQSRKRLRNLAVDNSDLVFKSRGKIESSNNPNYETVEVIRNLGPLLNVFKFKTAVAKK